MPVAIDELQQFLACVAGDDAAANVEHRPLGFLDQADDFVEHQIAGAFVGIVAAQVNFAREHRLCAGSAARSWADQSAPGRAVRSARGKTLP